MAVNGASLTAGAAGSILLWSAITGNGVLKSLREIIKGEAPGSVPAASTGDSTGGGSGGSGTAIAPTGQTLKAAEAANQALGKAAATLYGWGSGQQWIALNNVIMRESGWDAFAANPTSDARGIGQNINGWSAGYMEGNAPQQIAWTLNYIKGRYGDPIAAWEHEESAGWY